MSDDDLDELKAKYAAMAKGGGCECCGAPVVLIEKDGRVTGYHHDWTLHNAFPALVERYERQAEEAATLRAECESHRNARRTLADDLVALGAGKPTVLELSRGADRRIAKLEAERDAALAEVTRLRGNLEVTEKHYDELADFVERTPREEQARELMRLRNLLARVEVDERWRLWKDVPKEWEAFQGFRQDCGVIFVERAGGRLFTDEGREDITDDPPTHARPLPLPPADEAELERLRQAVAMEGETP